MTNWPEVADRAFTIVEVAMVVAVSAFWCAFLPVIGLLYLLDMLP